MKRFLLLLLTLVLSLTFVACNTENDQTSSETSSETLPIEVKEFGYSLENGYIHYSIILHNPNEDKAIELPTFRITARDEANAVLASEEQTLSIIYPKQDFAYAFLAFEVEKEPKTVDVEVLELDDYKIKNVSVLDNPEYNPLVAINTAYRTDKIVGEIQNNNNYDIDNGVISIIFKDDAGKIIGGTSTFIDSIKANSATPFDVAIYEKFATDNFEVYANIW